MNGLLGGLRENYGGESPDPKGSGSTEEKAGQAGASQSGAPASGSTPTNPAAEQKERGVVDKLTDAYQAFKSKVGSLFSGETQASPSRPPSEGTQVERARRTEQTREFNQLADKLAAGSPAAARALEQFRSQGGEFHDGQDSGYFKDGKPPVIGILTRGWQGPTDERARMGTIGHELGHFDYARNHAQPYQPPGSPTGVSDRQIEHRRQADYIRGNTDRLLGDEAHANTFNATVRDEYLRNTGQPIDVSGVDNGPFRTVGSKASLRDAYGGFKPSGTPPGTNYRSYYGEGYRKHYEEYHLPGR